MVKVLSNRFGVPFVQLDDGEVIPVTQQFQGDLVALELQEPGSLDTALESIRQAVWRIARVNPALPEEDWWMALNELLTINEFIGPLHAVQNARRQADAMRAEVFGE